MSGGIRISQLPSITAMTNDDILIVNDGNTVTRKITYADFLASLGTGRTIGDGQLTIKDSGGNDVGSFTANSLTNVDITLPAPPTVGDGQLSIKDSDGVSLGSFNANATDNVEIVIPAASGVDTDALKAAINTRRHTTSRVDISETALWVGETAPVADPSGHPGWYFSSDNSKITWNLWTQDTDATKQFKYEDLRSASLVVRVAGPRYPFFSIYTRRKNDGNDANVGYRSRYTFETAQDDSAGVVKARLLTTLTSNPLNTNMPHTIATFNPGSSVGPMEADEVIKNITISTNSGATAGQFEFNASELILDTTTEMFSVQLQAKPVTANAARMFYQTEPGVLVRQTGDFWYDTVNSQLKLWSGSAWIDV